MTRRLPSATPAEVIRALERAGWEVHRQRGSHVSLKKQGVAYIVTVPMHRRDVPRGTLAGIIKDAGMTIDEFVDLL
ncbi:MAG: type II toxin-antitoxin system HicA family toxin [Dehalococcoidia bacterium]